MQENKSFREIKLKNIKFVIAYYNINAMADFSFLSNNALFIKTPSHNWTLFIDNSHSKIITVKNHILHGQLSLGSLLKPLYSSILCHL